MITKDDLLKWLKSLDTKLDKPITLVAVGGTAMTLLELKPSTVDVDFCVDRKNFEIFKKLIKGEYKFKIDAFVDGYIFSVQLPDDYLELSKSYKTGFKNIELRILSFIDIIITKSSRYNMRDEEDIAILVKTKKIDKEELIKRFNDMVESYAGSKSDFRYNFEIILRRHFS